MRFRLLGSLEVLDSDGTTVEVGGAQSRSLLAALLLAGGHVVSADTLIEAVWGDEPPASAAGSLQAYISRLRRSLGDAVTLRWERPGYALHLPAGSLDVGVFEARAEAGRALLGAGRASEARAALTEALAEWRGPALAEFVDRSFAVGAAARLEERRLAALEDRLAADLALGHHAAATGELAELVAANPLREGLRGALALALYRSGRQAEALRSLDEARRTLVDELGVSPGRPLQDLERAILAQDPSLDLRADVVGPEAATTSPGDQDGAPDPAGVPDPTPGVALVGRHAELRELRLAMDEARRATRVVVVEGEPGIGKTRLAEELADVARLAGLTVLWGQAFEGSGAPALWPWLPPLRALADDRPPGTSLASELRTLLAPSDERDPAAVSAGPARYALFMAVDELLVASAARRPILLVLDDVQWADPASLELLGSVAGRLHDVPMLVLCTVRELEVGRNDEVVEVLAALTRKAGTRRMHLRGLTAADTAELVLRTTDQQGALAAAEAIHERADGNPFFATELARLLAAGLTLDDVPSGVRDVVRRRLAPLPPGTTEVLQTAAVIGREAEVGLVARALGRHLDQVLDDLEPAVVQRLVVSSPQRPALHRFSHALVREVVLDGVSTLRRARLHLRVADALEASHGGDDDAEILAEHLWAAAAIGVGHRAAEALERAAAVAIRRTAYASAQSLLERAVQLRRTAGSGPAERSAEAGAITHLVSVISTRSGTTVLLGSPLLARGQQLAEETGRTLELLHLLWVGWAGLDLSNRRDDADPLARELLERSEKSGLPLARVLGHTAYGISCWHQGRVRDAAHHLGLAAGLDVSDTPSTPTTVLFERDQVRISVPFSLYLHDLMGDVEEPDQRYEEVVRIFPDDRFWELLVCNFASSSALSTGDIERTVRWGRRAVAADPDGLSDFWSRAQRCYLGVGLCMSGQLEQGLPMFEEAWAGYRGIGLRTNGATWLATRTHALALAGRTEEAERSLAEATHELRAYRDRYAESTVLLAAAALEHARGDDPAAILQEARRVAEEQGATAMAARVVREAARMGIELGTSPG